MEEDRAKGTGKQVAGSIQDAVGTLTVDAKTGVEGTAEKTPGTVQNATQLRGAMRDDEQVMALHAEQVVLSKRVRRTQVRVARTTHTREQAVEADLSHDQVIVERVVIGRVVDAVPDVRQEGDVTILPVVEEVFVRRLMLKEEVHIRRVRTTERFAETVTLREQEATVTRTAIAD